MLLPARTSLTLLTDLYQLTMAAGYHRCGLLDREAVFHLFFRKNPFGSAWSIACGLGQVLDFIDRFHFEKEDLDYLAGLTGNDGKALFDPVFLRYLAELRLSVDIDAMPEGSLVFPYEPLLRVRGPLAQCQLLETPLLTLINSQTLFATKAARVVAAAAGDPVLEFGLRRSQGIDGGLSVARATYIGGCAATSNVLAGKLYGIPVKGTHAHSWVMAFTDERQAFDAYARAMPNNCILLVDTYDALAGVRHAVEVALELRRRGHQMVGIRLDSGDLVALSQAARRLLDEAGLPEAMIVASNDLDEHEIARLKAAGAAIGVWGVGTRLATAYDQPALGGVYKLAAIRDSGGAWRYTSKISEEAGKSTLPGVQQVRRFYDADGRPRGDLIWDEELGSDARGRAVAAEGREVQLASAAEARDLLQAAVRRGRRVLTPSLEESRQRCRGELASLAPEIRRLRDPEVYPTYVDRRLDRAARQLLASS